MSKTNDKNVNKAQFSGQSESDNSSRISYISQKTQRLAGALYALTRPFPSDEPLRRTLRDQALALVSAAHSLAEGTPQKENSTALPGLLDQLISQLAVARDGGLISAMNFSVFREEIAGFLGEIDEFKAFPGPFLNSDYFSLEEKPFSGRGERNTPTLGSSSLSSSGSAAGDQHQPKTSEAGGKLTAKDKRRRKILDLFKNQPEITVNDVTEIVNGYSTKTIQRDLKALVKNGELEKHGKRRWTSYTRA